MLQEDGGYSGDTEVFVAFVFDLKPSLSSGAIVASPIGPVLTLLMRFATDLCVAFAG